jgi:hypothetical protein
MHISKKLLSILQEETTDDKQKLKELEELCETLRNEASPESFIQSIPAHEVNGALMNLQGVRLSAWLASKWANHVKQSWLDAYPDPPLDTMTD